MTKGSKKELKNNEEKSFFEKMRTDEKYSSKVQLAGFGIFILLVIVYLNIEGAKGNINPSISNTVGDINNEIIETQQPEKEEQPEKVSLLKQLSNNYEYNINVNVTKIDENTTNYQYYGKNYQDNKIINKKTDEGTKDYYSVDDYLYRKNNNEYELVTKEEIYNLIDKKYFEVSELLKLIQKANLEHIVDSTTGAKESIYNLLVRDIEISNKTNDVVTIKVIEDENKLTINVDYTNLIKIFDTTITKCEIEYVYTNINKVEEFKIIENTNGDTNE